jgi:hypothetical protein
MFLEQVSQLLLKTAPPVVFGLVPYIRPHGVDIALTHGECRVAFLPRKGLQPRESSVDPTGGISFDPLQDIRNSAILAEADQCVDVIVDTSDLDRLSAFPFDHATQIVVNASTVS